MKEPCGFSWGMRFRNPLVASIHMKNTIRISYVCKQVSQDLWSINSIKTIVYLEFVWYKWCHVQVKSPIKLWCFFCKSQVADPLSFTLLPWLGKTSCRFWLVRSSRSGKKHRVEDGHGMYISSANVPQRWKINTNIQDIWHQKRHDQHQYHSSKHISVEEIME